MQTLHVRCPACGTLLNVPAARTGGPVRCGKCRWRFALPRSAPAPDDTIVGWLTKQAEPDEEPLTEPERAAAAPAGQLRADQTAVLPAIQDCIRLVKLDTTAALFEFPAHWLRKTAFRCAMPRRCLRCGGVLDIRPHLIIYTVPLASRTQLEAAHSVQGAIDRSLNYRDMEEEELLNHLPHVSDVPAPADLPMPYWVCGNCSATGLVSGKIHLDPATGQGLCRLLVHELSRAEEFLVAAGGDGTPDHDRLRRRIQEAAEHPWRGLSPTVRHRLEQWFTAERGEQPAAYIPDRDHSSPEDGLCGLVISDQRLVFHAKYRHYEMPVIEPLELQLAMRGGRGSLRIWTRGWQVPRFCVDGEGVQHLRRALAGAKFRVTWR